MSQVTKSSQHKQRGVALLEVLIAFFVLSVGLLGLAGLQIKSLQFNQSAFQQSQANISVYDMLDRMRMNRSAASAGEYDTGGFIREHEGDSELADQDISQWLVSVAGNLPDGEGRIVCDDNEVCTVSIRWSNRLKSGDGEDDAYETVSLSSQI